MMRTLENALKKRMEDPEFRAEYEALEPECAIMQVNRGLGYNGVVICTAKEVLDDDL